VIRKTLLSADMNMISWFDKLESSDVLYWTEKACGDDTPETYVP
jgi:hypothetical protein